MDSEKSLNTLEYYNADGEEISIPIKTKFIYTKLRIDVLKFDAEGQKEYKKLQDEADAKLSIENSKKLQDQMDKKVEEYKTANPNSTEAEIELKKQMIQMELASEIDEGQIDLNLALTSKVWEFGDSRQKKLLKLLVNCAGMEVADKALINSGLDSDFWSNVNMGKVTAINANFRSIHSV